MKTKIMLAAAVSMTAAILILASGCSKKQQPANPVNWVSQKFKLQTTYPDSWKVNDQEFVEDPKSGRVRVAVFAKPNPLGTGEVSELPPMVVIRWTPGAQSQGPRTTPGPVPIPQSMINPDGNTAAAGWDAFGAVDIKTREFKWAGSIPAAEATATAKSGTAFYATYTNQLAGATMDVRNIYLTYPTGTFDILRVAPKDSPTLAEADSIVDALAPTKQ